MIYIFSLRITFVNTSGNLKNTYPKRGAPLYVHTVPGIGGSGAAHNVVELFRNSHFPMHTLHPTKVRSDLLSYFREHSHMTSDF